MTSTLVGVVVAQPEALRIEGLHKSFGDLEVLKGIDLVIAEHEVVCLIGASGSGKSTLLRCVDRLVDWLVARARSRRVAGAR